MKRKFIFLACFMLSLLISLVVVSSLFTSTIRLETGRNMLNLNESGNFYASSLVALNPHIRTISYRDGEDVVGYINHFGGIGKDFVMYSGNTYEIVTDKDFYLTFPN